MTKPSIPKANPVGDHVDSDEALVFAAQTGDRNAFSKLVERHFGLVYSLAWSSLRNEDAAQDLSQEVFLRAWLQISKLRDQKKFVSWIAQMTRNLGRDWNRKGESFSKVKKMIELENEKKLVQGQKPEALQRMEENERDEAAQLVLDSVSEEQRELLILHCDQGLSHRKIAEHLGIHHTTVGRQIEKALSTARGILQGDSGKIMDSLKIEKPARGAHEAISLIAIAAALPVSTQATVLKTIQASAPSLSVISTTAESTTSSFKIFGFIQTLIQFLFSGGAMVSTIKITSTIAVVGVAAFLFKNTNTESGFNIFSISAYSQNPVTQQSTFSLGEIDVFIPFGEAAKITFDNNFFKINEMIASADEDGTVVLNWDSSTTLFTGSDSMMVSPGENTEKNWKWYFEDDANSGIWSFISIHCTHEGDGIRLNLVLDDSEEMYRVTQATFPAYFNGTITKFQAVSNFEQGLIQSDILPEYEPHRIILLESTKGWIN